MLDSFLCDQFLYSHNKTNFVFDAVKRRFIFINLLVLKGSKNGYFTASPVNLQCKLAALNFLLETSSI